MRDLVIQFIQENSGTHNHAGSSEARFNDLALKVFAYQYETVPAYRRFCTKRGISPASSSRSGISHWGEIPAIPVDAFKQNIFDEPGVTARTARQADRGSATFAREAEPAGPNKNEQGRRAHVFLSSGSSHGMENRSRHCLSGLTTYKLSAMAHFRDMVLADGPGPMAVLLLGPSANTHPHSSLGRMFSWCGEEFGHREVEAVFGAGGAVDLDRAIAWLQQRCAESRPVLILALSSALSALISRLRENDQRLRLPADSRIVDTGGNKGGPVLSAKGLLKAAWRFLHVPAYLCVNEYGMTEMLSQFYDDALRCRIRGGLLARSKIGPAWVRSVLVNPRSLQPVQGGCRGLLRHLDLANWESISALQTLDVGIVAGDGFIVQGRATGAETRGCSQLLSTLTGAK